MKNILKKIIVAIGFLLLSVIILTWYFLVGPSSHKTGSAYNKGKNAIWISHSWVGNQHSEEDIAKLVEVLKKNQIRYVYVHAGPLEKDGNVPKSRYPYAAQLIAGFKKYDPDHTLLVLAWLGQRRQLLDYSEPTVRDNISYTSQFFVYNLSFDGIHIDIEPVPNHDQAFLLLLESIKSRIGEYKILSVASDEWQPELITKLASKVLKKAILTYWNMGYFNEVAKTADQIVVMTYDTGFFLPETYSWFVAQQLIYITKAVNNKEVLIGIPSYAEERDTFHPLAENMESGLDGIIKGLNNWRSRKSSFAGVAIYPEWETDSEEWQIYEKLWLGEGGNNE